MLQFSRIQATIILVTVLAICGFAVPSFVSDQTIRGWPDWAQRRITLAPDLQGGTSALRVQVPTLGPVEISVAFPRTSIHIPQGSYRDPAGAAALDELLNGT